MGNQWDMAFDMSAEKECEDHVAIAESRRPLSSHGLPFGTYLDKLLNVLVLLRTLFTNIFVSHFQHVDCNHDQSSHDNTAWPSSHDQRSEMHSILKRNNKCSENSDDDIEEDEEEGLGRYIPGGFHPVRLGDEYHRGRYKVLRKLGHGLHFTLWLVGDQNEPRYLSMKVLDATSSVEDEKTASERAVLQDLRTANVQHQGYEYINHLVDDFEHQGPNGTHVCLLFEPMGETLSSFPTRFSPDHCVPSLAMKRIVLKLLAALEYAHESGARHNNIAPESIFLKMIDKSRIDSLYLHSREPHIAHQNSDEEYQCVKSWPLRSFYHEGFQDCDELDICIGDWGPAAWGDQHYCDATGPMHLRAPEVILKAVCDERADLWSLGAMVLKVFRGARMFSTDDGGGYSQPFHLMQMEQMFGGGSFPKSLLQRADQQLVAQWFEEDDGRVKGYESVGVPDLKDECWMGDLEEGERHDFVSWLHFLMRIDPEERPSIAALCEHPWLRAAE